MHTLIATTSETVAGVEMTRDFILTVYRPSGSLPTWAYTLDVNFFVRGKHQIRTSMIDRSNLTYEQAKTEVYKTAHAVRTHFAVNPLLKVKINNAHVSDLARYFNS